SYYTGTEPGSQPNWKDRLKDVTDAAGLVSTATYTLSTTTRQESVSVPKPSGGLTTNQATYDERGNPIDGKDALGSPDPTWSTSTYSSDLLKQRGTPSEVRQHAQSGDVVTTLAYDAKGNLTSSTDALGGVTRTTYDDLGNVLTESDPVGNTTSNNYDNKGNLL